MVDSWIHYLQKGLKLTALLKTSRFLCWANQSRVRCSSFPITFLAFLSCRLLMFPGDRKEPPRRVGKNCEYSCVSPGLWHAARKSFASNSVALEPHQTFKYSGPLDDGWGQREVSAHISSSDHLWSKMARLSWHFTLKFVLPMPSQSKFPWWCGDFYIRVSWVLVWHSICTMLDLCCQHNSYIVLLWTC